MPKRRSDVFSCSGAGNESGSVVLDTLQWINCWLTKCCQNGVTVIHFGCHKSRYQTRHDIGNENFLDGFKVAKMEKADMNDGAGMDACQCGWVSSELGWPSLVSGHPPHPSSRLLSEASPPFDCSLRVRASADTRHSNVRVSADTGCPTCAGVWAQYHDHTL